MTLLSMLSNLAYLAVFIAGMMFTWLFFNRLKDGYVKALTDLEGIVDIQNNVIATLRRDNGPVSVQRVAHASRDTHIMTDEEEALIERSR